jgi:hypothetical protein
MRRVLLYDRETGRLVHSHYEVRVVQDDEGRLSEPDAASPDAALAELVTRGLDPGRLGSLATDVAPESSRRTERSVDPASGELRARRVPRSEGHAPQDDTTGEE